MDIRKPARALLATFLFTLLAGLGGAWSATAQSTTGLVIGNSGAISYSEQAAATPIAPNLTLNLGAGDALDQVRVEFTAGYQQGQDALGIGTSTATSGTTSGISWTWTASSGILALSGSATAATYQSVLRQITFRNGSDTPSSTQRQLRFSLGSGLQFAGNGHFYEFVAFPGVEYGVARDAALARRYFGLRGYLTTIMSAAENNFVAAKLQGRGWMGASDDSGEGQWYWRTGPEDNTQFWQGASDGSAVNGNYTNWESGEPNDSGNEDYAHFLTSGKWNDYPAQNAQVDGYVVEYGGMPGDPTLALAATASVNVVPVNDPPTGLQLSPASVQENLPGGTVVGTFSQTDPDGGPTFSYSLVSGAGDTDNASFRIAGNQLVTNAKFDYETKSSYTVRVQVSDGNGGTAVAPFPISIINQDIAPTLTSSGQPSVPVLSPYTAIFLARGDPPTMTYSISAGTLPAGLSIDPATGIVSGTPTATGSFNFTVQASNGVNPPATKAFALTVTKRPLSAYADPQMIRVGNALPTFTLSYIGFLPGDTAAVLDIAPTVSSPTANNAAAGSYPIVVSGGSDDIYELVRLNNTLKVEDKLIPALSWANPGNITFGTPLSGAQLNATVSNPSGLAGTFTYAPAPGAILDVGQAQSLDVTFDPGDSNNYASSTRRVLINVSPKALIITAADQTITAGDPAPALSITYNGLAGGDAETGVPPTVQIDPNADLNRAGSYEIQVFGAQDSNYTISYVTGTLTVRLGAATGGTSSVAPGSTFPFTATGFAPGEQVTIKVGGAVVGTVIANADGVVQTSIFLDSGAPTGPYPLTAEGATSGSVGTTINLASGAPQQTTLVGTVINGRPAGPGSQVPFGGGGFTPGEQVAIKVNGRQVGTVTADGNGKIDTRLAFDPGTAPGTYTVQAVGGTFEETGQVTIAAGAPVTQAPGNAPLINTGAGGPGSHFPFQAGGFTPGQRVDILVDGKKVGEATASISGTIGAVIYLDPNTPPGVHTIQAGSPGPSEQVGIATGAPPRSNPGGAPTLSNTDEVGAPGGYFPFSGTGYQPGETVQLFVNGVLAGTATADSNGNVTAALKFNGGIPAGSYPVTGRGVSSGASSRALVTIDPNGPERHNPGNLPVVGVESVHQYYLPLVRR